MTSGRRSAFGSVSASVPALAFLLLFPPDTGAMGGIPGPIRLPPGVHIDLYSGEVPGARSMALGDDGTLFVRRSAIYRIR